MALATQVTLQSRAMRARVIPPLLPTNPKSLFEVSTTPDHHKRHCERSAAIQVFVILSHGLPRRFAPRSDATPQGLAFAKTGDLNFGVINQPRSLRQLTQPPR